MKKFLMAVAMIATSLTASAQYEAGSISLKPLVGINMANLTNSGGDMKVGFAAGAELGYQLDDKFLLTGGLIYSQQGSKDEGVKINLEYINVPLLANYYVAKGFAIKAGIQPAFRVKSSVKAGGVEVDGDGAKDFDFSIPIGLSYEISDFVIDARYNWGLTKVVDVEEGDAVKNSVFQITLGYKFGL